MVRLTIPRRAYTNSHMEFVADAVTTLYENRSGIRGLKIVYEAPFLRHFPVRFERL
ncbi:MAG: hypothetical protein U9N35_08625 [Euryarchaeota archaeon]|nr:hypothetical protein [Euryarchaeota archaeon]